MKTSAWAVTHLAVVLAITLAASVSSLGVEATNFDSIASISSTGRRLLAKPTPIKKRVQSKKPATAKVALTSSSTTTVQTSGQQGGTGKNRQKAIFKTTTGAANGTVMTARGFAVNSARALILSASKGKKVKGSIAVSSKLSGSSKGSHSQGVSMKLKLQKAAKGRRLSAVCDNVPILITAYYTISCVQLNIVLASLGMNKSTTCVEETGEQIFIASAQYNVSSNTSATYNLPASFNGFSSIDIELLDASCGSLVIQNIDISVSAGVLTVTPLVKKWASGQIVVALGNNKIDVRSKTSQNTYDLGGNSSVVIKGVTRYNSFDKSEKLIAVNLLVCKYSTSELANIAVGSDGTHSVVDTFAIQDTQGALVHPIKAICSFYDNTCLIQAFRSNDSATLLLTFNVLDIVARSSTALPKPIDSIILDGALGGFTVADSNTIFYGSGDGITMVDTDSNHASASVSASASASARDSSSETADAPAPGPMTSESGIPFDGASNCSDVVLDYKLTLQGSYNRVNSLLYTTVAACGKEVIEYNNESITRRKGTSSTKDGGNWSALINVDYSQGFVYNNVKADYIAVTSTGKVAAFKLGSINEPTVFYSVTTTSGSAGIAVIQLPISN